MLPDIESKSEEEVWLGDPLERLRAQLLELDSLIVREDGTLRKKIHLLLAKIPEAGSGRIREYFLGLNEVGIVEWHFILLVLRALWYEEYNWYGAH
jgi:hypothetical protein